MQRTRDLLHGALASLIHEKAYDDIVVKEILARANVGRSTFYTHFRDKHELLDSGIRDMLRAGAIASPTPSAGAANHALRFSRPVFEHIGRYRGDGDAQADAQGLAVVHERLQWALVELIADDLRRMEPRRQGTGRDVPCDLLAQYVASTFLVVLNWWLGRREPLPAEKANDVFLALVSPTLRDVLG